MRWHWLGTQTQANSVKPAVSVRFKKEHGLEHSTQLPQNDAILDWSIPGKCPLSFALAINYQVSLQMLNLNHPIEERIDVEHSTWMRQKNEILALTVTVRIQFLAILILACALGFIMLAQPHLDALPYSSIFFDTPR